MGHIQWQFVKLNRFLRTCQGGLRYVEILLCGDGRKEGRRIELGLITGSLYRNDRPVPTSLIVSAISAGSGGNGGRIPHKYYQTQSTIFLLRAKFG